MNTPANNRTAKELFTEWLEKLQQESWQLELLISGFALFGIYSARTLIKDLEVFRNNETFDEFGAIAGILLFIIQKGWLIFFINLVIHVILRGLWIGAIGLRYVSGEIEYDTLNYSPKFTNYLKKAVGSYDDFIERLEKICSVLFAYTFLLFLLFASLMLFVLQFMAIFMIGAKLGESPEKVSPLITTLGILYLFIGCIVFIDLISLGSIKKIKDKSVSTIYLYIYRFFSLTTLSFLYRPLLYNFLDHKYTKQLLYLSIPYIIVIIFGQRLIENSPFPFFPDENILTSHALGIDNYHYDDLREIQLNEYANEERKLHKKEIGIISMEQFDVNKSTSSVFIKIDHRFDKLIRHQAYVTPYKKEGFVLRWFGYSNVEDESLKDTKNDKSKAIADLIDKRRQLRKQSKDNKNSSFADQIDSINILIKIKQEAFNDEISLLEKTKAKDIMGQYLDQITLRVDTIEIPKNQCYFYTHPHNAEKGIKCFFATDSLDIGLHTLYFSRNYLDIKDSIYKKFIALPFNKI